MNSKLMPSLVAILAVAGIFGYANLSNEPAGTNNTQIIQELTFETISKQAYSGHEMKADYVIRDAEDWQDLWSITNSQIIPEPGMPNVDFNNEMIIAAFQGEHSTGGYSIEILKIIEKENSVEVFIRETTPEPGAILTQAFTQPYHIIKTKRVNKEVEFKKA